MGPVNYMFMYDTQVAELRVSFMTVVTRVLTTSNPKDPHDSYYRRVDINEAGFHLFQNNSDNGQNHDSHIQLVPPMQLNETNFPFFNFNKVTNIGHNCAY